MKIITLLAICISSTLYAHELLWHHGSIVLTDKSVLQGEIAIQPAFDLVLFRDSSGLMVYPAHKLMGVYYHDAVANINRKYISIKDESAFGRYTLFETVFYSELQVLRKITGRNADPNDDAESYNYYVLFNHVLVPFASFSSQIFNKLKYLDPGFAEMVKHQKLDPTAHKDIVPIIKLYINRAPVYAVTRSAS